MKTTLLIPLLFVAACSSVTAPQPEMGTIWHNTTDTLTIYSTHATIGTLTSINFKLLSDTAYLISFPWTSNATTEYFLRRSSDTLNGTVTAYNPNEVFGVAPAVFWK